MYIVSTTMNQSWRTRNNYIRTNGFTRTFRGNSLQMRKSYLDQVLPDEKMQSSTTRTMVKSLLVDRNQLENCKKLIEGMSKLKEMNLLKGK
jgi:hypothetical protein